jgi:hypothetical protein
MVYKDQQVDMELAEQTILMNRLKKFAEFLSDEGKKMICTAFLRTLNRWEDESIALDLIERDKETIKKIFS